MADFLRNSEPPTPMPEEFRRDKGAGGGAGEEKEEKGPGVWGRLKGRRKGVR